MISTNSEAARCLFVSSYHQGYAWADGIEEGVRSVLEDKCELKQINMDTKRNKDEEYKLNKGLQVKQFIEKWQPDIVIAADDNASKYVVVPYFKDSPIPFVFCGVNWTVNEYGYPFSNVTGMVEVSPINEAFEKIKQIDPEAKSGSYIGANTLTEEKSYKRFKLIAQRYNLTLQKRLPKTQAEWNQAYIKSQQDDFVILGTKSGIDDWNDEQAYQFVTTHGKKLSLTTYQWMVRFSVLGLTKVAQEHGEWAAKTALEILAGRSADSIPIIPNQKWDLWLNPTLVKNINVTIPEYILIKSKKVDG